MEQLLNFLISHVVSHKGAFWVPFSLSRYQQLANCLKPISSWMGNHGMAINVAKTESMVIATRPKLARLQGQRIQITHNGTAIKSVYSHKLLGLVLDES